MDTTHATVIKLTFKVYRSMHNGEEWWACTAVDEDGGLVMDECKSRSKTKAVRYALEACAAKIDP